MCSFNLSPGEGDMEKLCRPLWHEQAEGSTGASDVLRAQAPKSFIDPVSNSDPKVVLPILESLFITLCSGD